MNSTATRDARQTAAVFVAAFKAPDVSASAREVVETVRVHILPAERITFTTIDGGELEVGGADVVAEYAESLEAYRKARGSTYIPVLLDHDGEAVGMVAAFEAEEDGIYAVLDLWAEGNEGRKGRDFVSAYWEFAAFDDDGGVPRVAYAHEVSFTNKPQFDRNQTPVARANKQVYAKRAEALFALAAKPNEARAMMTPEEMIEAMIATDAFSAAIAEHVAKAMESAAPDEEPEAPAPAEEEAEAAAADDAKPDDEEEAEAAASEPAAVAASLVAKIDQLTATVDEIKRSTQVAASLRGQAFHPTPVSDGVPTEFGARIVHYRNQGMSPADAVAAAQNRE